MQGDNQKTLTEESTERPVYRIRNGSSSQQLNYIINRDKNSMIDLQKVKQQKEVSSLQVSQDGFKNLIKSQRVNTENSNQSYNEKVNTLLKKISGNNVAQTYINKRMSTDNIMKRKSNQSSGSIKYKLNIQQNNEQKVQNNFLLESKLSPERSLNFKSTQQDVFASLGITSPISVFNGYKQNKKNKNKMNQSQQQQSLQLLNSKSSLQLQSKIYSSQEDLQLQSQESQDQIKNLSKIPQQLQKIINSQNQGKSDYINVQKQECDSDVSKVCRTITSRLKIDDNEEDQVQNQNENIEDQELLQQENQDLEGEDGKQIEYFNNFTTNITTNSQYQKNMYTSNDSRFKFINQLKNKNSQLENIISELKTEINEVDEFKIVLDKYEQKKINNEEVLSGIDHEKRIMMLKAQITKQQRQIRQLNSLLTSSRKSFKEVLEVTQFLIDHISSENDQNINFGKYQNSQFQQSHNKQIQSVQSQKQMNLTVPSKNANAGNNQSMTQISNNQTSTNLQQNQQRNSITSGNNHDQTLPNTEESIQVFFNQVSQNQAYSQLLSALVQVEDRQKFIQNFNVAFTKVIQFQYKSEEFKKLFTIKKNRVTQQAEVKFNHPLRLLFDQFQNCFPVHTLFDYLDKFSKQNIQNKLIAMMSLLRKTDRVFKKIRTYQLFKNNPIHFKEKSNQGDISVPNLLLENQKLFSEFMQARGQSKIISLNYEKIMKTETQLGELLYKMVHYFNQIQSKGEYSEELSDLVNSLRNGCESLICLGILIPNEQGSLSEKIAVVSETEQKKLNQDQLTYDSKQKQNEWFDYDRKMSVLTDFNEKRGTLSLMFDEFQSAAHIKDYKSCNELLNKIGSILYSFKAMFETKDNVINLKNYEIAYLKNQQLMRKQDQELVYDYIEQMQQQINLLLQPFNSKLNLMLSSFTALIDNGKVLDIAQRQNHIYTFKRTMKEILESIKMILNNQFQSNQINLLTLQQQFNERVQQTSQRFNRLKPFISKPAQL